MDMRSRSKGPAPGEEDGADGEAKAPELRLSMSGSLQKKLKCFGGCHACIAHGLQAVSALMDNGSWQDADAVSSDRELEAYRAESCIGSCSYALVLDSEGDATRFGFNP